MQRGEMVPLIDLVNRFNVDHDRMFFMLSHWVRKGNVAHYQTKCNLSGNHCKGCSFAETDYFCWKKQQISKIAVLSVSDTP